MEIKRSYEVSYKEDGIKIIKSNSNDTEPEYELFIEDSCVYTFTGEDFNTLKRILTSIEEDEATTIHN